MGRYQLLAKLATGGMAEIYLARQTGIKGFERLVAVKKLFPHLAVEEKFLEMFFDEARIAATLNHPNIVQIYDLGQEEESYFIAMEYLEGESLGYMLRECHKSKTPIPATLAAGIVSQVCDGLDYAHKLTDDLGKPLGIVHRDVSPQNIIVLFSGGVKLVDFGIAKAASKSHKTSIGMFKGKLAYMSPEQCLGKPVDNRSDIFSLGTVFWELLTQRRLFKGDNKLTVMESIVSGEVPPLRKYKPDLSVELESITLQALQKDPNKRFRNTKEMGAAIQGYLRRIGAAAGVQEIAGFVKVVFSERAQKKRKLLEAIRSGDTTRVTQVTLDVLKPVTGDTSPSQPGTPDDEDTQEFEISQGKIRLKEEPPPSPPKEVMPVEAKTAPLKAHPLKKQDEQQEMEMETVQVDLDELEAKGLDVKSLSTVPHGQPPVKKPRRLGLWLGLPVLMVAAFLATWYLVGGIPGDDPAPAEPLGVSPDPATTGSRVTTPDEKSPKVGPAKPVDGKKAAKINPALDVQPTRLRISSKPAGCVVQIDAKNIPGQTPIEQVTVDSRKEHEVAVLCKDHLREAKKIKGLPGEEIVLHFVPTTSKTAAIQPKPEIKKPEAPKPKTTKPKVTKPKVTKPKVTKPKPPKRKVVKRRTRYGRLRIDTEPWSVVYVGKRKLGITPIMGVKLPAGTHKVTAVNKEQGLKKTFKITIRSKKTTTVHKKLSQ
jgi:serine/threonine-protein kinase